VNKTLMSSKKQDWQTPPEILELVRKIGPIALDPATTEDNPCEARGFLTVSGLTSDWRNESYLDPADSGTRGLIYVNPPYGRALADWATKISHEGMRGCEIISLTPARTDTKWFRKMTTADVMCFWRGRITFVGAKDPAPFPSLVCYWGPKPDRFREVFGSYGWCPL
jgi:hypothetical protein